MHSKAAKRRRKKLTVPERQPLIRKRLAAPP